MDSKANKIISFSLLALFAVVFISGCIEPGQGGGTALKEMPRFESYGELVAAFEEAGNTQYGIMYNIAKGIAMPMIAESADGRAADRIGGSDYSATNIQVEGVDEADIVKTDGKYIYNFSSGNLIITDAYPIENAAIISKTELEGVSPMEMFVSGNRLLLFGNKARYYGEQGIAREDMSYPYYGYGNVAVQLYDISNKEEPELIKELEFEGSYLTSRLIGEHAYFVVNSWPHYGECDKNEGCIIPMMKIEGIEQRVAEATEIGYLYPMPAESFVTIASLNLETEEMEKETIAGSAQNVYASQDNIYLAATAWLPPETPILKDVERIVVGDAEKTVVNKFSLEQGKIGYVGQGSVPGHVLNQFSMDEHEGNFRIATTLGQVSRMLSQSSNNLYVLDEEMNTIGRLEGLAPGEKIYSARFMGERAYMVTFKKIDPLFVIDVSEPENPKVLGKLKIPGYSDYLHPIDEDHIIGVGKDTISSNYDTFSWYQGIKMAIFDVSDVENPIEMHKIVIGDRGTESPALQDHKAFLFDREKELLVIPITLSEIPDEEKKPLEENQISPSYGTPVFQGAFVYKVNLEDGFEEQGRITHISEEEELKRGYYYGYEHSVQRSLYIGNVLYTLSEKMLKANDLDSLENLREFAFG
ncbi:MAG: beta-propeller domain-containing protein [Candidatus Diapherotrites archaeon]|uniref:Beta-propeller domain-containing protein n=1 Tax=Candidatus Iainarchaeum sp. TaxID=3101447 RepID=A0A939C768_9ARCH|nr:beta-propeller domain-containing protein [Candidatus Diapherotrites archaeon]